MMAAIELYNKPRLEYRNDIFTVLLFNSIRLSQVSIPAVGALGGSDMCLLLVSSETIESHEKASNFSAEGNLDTQLAIGNFSLV